MTDADLDRLAALPAVTQRRRELWKASRDRTAQSLTVQAIAEAGPQRHPLVQACRRVVEQMR